MHLSFKHYRNMKAKKIQIQKTDQFFAHNERGFLFLFLHRIIIIILQIRR